MNFTSGQLDPIIEENEPEEEYIFMDLNRKHFERSASSHLWQFLGFNKLRNFFYDYFFLLSWRFKKRIFTKNKKRSFLN